MAQFFINTVFPKIFMLFSDIIPEKVISDEEGAAYPYWFYARDLRSKLDDQYLEEHRINACLGLLSSESFKDMSDLFKGEIFDDTSHLNHAQIVKGYAELNELGMSIAQILFVNNAVKEGLHDLIENYDTLVADMEGYLRGKAFEKMEEFSNDTIRFYAEYFILQKGFDLLFMRKEPVGVYDTETGQYKLNGEYRESTKYLDLCSVTEEEACPELKELSYMITTGWGQNVSREVWDDLNQAYYSAKCPITGRVLLFPKYYDDMLNDLLPQFDKSKADIAKKIIAMLNGEDVEIIELGAGSGTLAIRLLMACKEAGIDPSRVTYKGSDPSKYMVSNFRSNIKTQIGDMDMPESWSLELGSMESFMANPGEKVAGKKRIVLLSYSAHHIHGETLEEFLASKKIRASVDKIIILDTNERHGSFKWAYMPADCQAPENFDNVNLSGEWRSETLFEEPSIPVERANGKTNAWCRARVLS